MKTNTNKITEAITIFVFISFMVSSFLGKYPLLSSLLVLIPLGLFAIWVLFESWRNQKINLKEIVPSFNTVFSNLFTGLAKDLRKIHGIKD